MKVYFDSVDNGSHCACLRSSPRLTIVGICRWGSSGCSSSSSSAV